MPVDVFNTHSRITRSEEPSSKTPDNGKLLDWLTGEIRFLLSKALKDKFNTTADFDMRVNPLQGFCSFSQAIGAYALIDKGLKPNPFSMQSLQA